MPDLKAFLGKVREWAGDKNDIRAILLVGSHARGQARADSDVDLMVLTNQPGKYLGDDSFARHFGIVEKMVRES